MNRFPLDQGLPRSAAEILRGRGWLVEHVGELGMASATDVEILELARQEGLAIVTLDADFHAWLAVNRAPGPSVIRLRIEGLKGPELANILENVLQRVGDVLAAGALVTVDARNIRIKHLPVTRGA